MTNAEIAQHFSLLADLLEVHGENPFKIKSYVNAAEVIEILQRPVIEISDEELYQIKGIGQAIGEKTRELQHTGHMQALEKVLDTTPPGILELLKVSGLSAKKIGTIWKALNIDTVAAFDEAAEQNLIAPLKGFGAKTQEGIRTAIAFYRENAGYLLWAKAEGVAQELLQQLQQGFPDNRFLLTGAIRRQENTINTIEIVSDVLPQDLTAFIENIPGSVIHEANDQQMGISFVSPPRLMVYFATKETLYQRQFLTTGAPAFNTAFTSVYPIPATAANEEAIFKAHNLPFIHPAQRESADVIDLAKTNTLPELIQPEDIRGIIHSHSTYSDGAATLEAMATAARDKGFEYLVISDHSQAAQYANGLYPDRIVKQHQEIDTLNEKLHPFKIFKSIEADILPDGNLDYTPEILSSFDLVITSVHSGLQMTEEKAMARLLKAIRNPFTTIMGHLTGRLLLRREGYPVDHKAIIDACADHQVVIEINANPRRLDLDWKWVEYALEMGVLLSINPDAHSIKGMDDVRYGVLAGQKGGLTAKQNLSSYSLTAFEQFVQQARLKRDA